MRPDRKGKKPVPPTPTSDADESPLRMWTPMRGEMSPMCVEMGLKSVERSVKAAPKDDGEVKSLQCDVAHFKGLSSFYRSLIDAQLETYFSGLAAMLQSHLWLSEEGFMPDCQQQAVANAEIATLTLRNKLLALEASSLAQQEKNLTIINDMKLEHVRASGNVKALEQQVAETQKLLKHKTCEVDTLQGKIEILQKTIKTKDDRLKKQFETHHARLVELRQERDMEHMQAKHKHDETSSVVKRLKKENQSLSGEMKTLLEDAQRLRLDLSRAEVKVESNASKLKNCDGMSAKFCALKAKYHEARRECTQLLVSMEGCERGAIVLDEGASFADLMHSHAKLQVDLRSDVLVKMEQQLKHNMAAHTTDSRNLQEQQATAQQVASEREAQLAAIQEELRIKAHELDNVLQELNERTVLQSNTDAKLASVEEDLHAKRQACLLASDANTAAQDELGTLKHEKAVLARRVLELENEAKELPALRKENSSTKQELRKSKETCSNLLTKLEDTADVLTDTNQEFEALKLKHASLGRATSTIQEDMQEEINKLKMALNEYARKLQKMDALGEELCVVKNKLSKAEGELAGSHKLTNMLDALNDEVDGYHADIIDLKERLACKEQELARVVPFKQKYHAAEKAHRASLVHLQNITEDYEATAGTITSSTPTMVRADTTSRFMVKVRAWYRATRRTPNTPPSPPSPAPAPPRVQMPTTRAKCSPSLNGWSEASLRRSVSPALSL